MAEKQLPSTVHHHFRDVKLFKEQELGHGSFATVCRALCDDLPCAAKVLHADFFDQQYPDPGEETFIAKFLEECKILPSITHPNIVQCFGTYRDPDTDLPVLLMELMDESLTDYIERFRDPLPYHIEISFSYDIALGLSYLHSRGYVHRDLSSNNVLIMAGIRAKITDFGMCRAMTGPSHVSRKIRLTLCPGTHPFMPPEALLEPPTYTDKLDVFTLGVVMIQIMSRQYPNPGLAHKPLPFSMLLQAIPEEERRSNHIKLIRCDHSMLPLAKQCIQNRQEMRPSSHAVCNHLKSLKESCEYQQSKDEASVERKLERESLLHQLQLTTIMMETQEKIETMKVEHSRQIEIIHRHYCEQLQLQHTKSTMDMQGKLETMKAEHSRQIDSIHRQHERELQLQVTKMTMDMQDKIATMKAEHSQQIKSLEHRYDNQNLLPNGHRSSASVQGSQSDHWCQPPPSPLLQQSGLPAQQPNMPIVPVNSKEKNAKLMYSVVPDASYPVTKGASIPFDPSDLPDPAFDTHDLEMFHQEACSTDDINPYDHDMLNLLTDPRSDDFSKYSGPNLDDHLGLSDPESPLVPDPQPRSFSGREEKGLDRHPSLPSLGAESAYPPVPRPRSDNNLLSMKGSQGLGTSHTTSMESNSSDNVHSEPHTSLDSGSPHPSLESMPSMSNKLDPCSSTPPEKAHSAYSGEKVVFKESSLENWVEVDIIVDKKDGKDGLFTRLRPRDRPAAFSGIDINAPKHPIIQPRRAYPCWYCTNLTTLEICDVCGNVQHEQKRETSV
jgi:serine/threonine protein kinase